MVDYLFGWDEPTEWKLTFKTYLNSNIFANIHLRFENISHSKICNHLNRHGLTKNLVGFSTSRFVRAFENTIYFEHNYSGILNKCKTSYWTTLYVKNRCTMVVFTYIAKDL